MTDELQNLQDRLNQARAEGIGQENKPHPHGSHAPTESEQKNMNMGIRAGTELVVSLVAGGGLGYALDQWLGTQPWLMIFFLFMGLCAAFLNIYKITQNLDSAVGFTGLQKQKKQANKSAKNTQEP